MDARRKIIFYIISLLIVGILTIIAWQTSARFNGSVQESFPQYWGSFFIDVIKLG